MGLAIAKGIIELHGGMISVAASRVWNYISNHMFNGLRLISCMKLRLRLTDYHDVSDGWQLFD